MSSSDPKESSTFLSVVAACDDFPYGPEAHEYYSLYLPQDEQPHGYMLPSTVSKMPWTSDFLIRPEIPRSITVLDSSHGKDIAAAINAAFQKLIDLCIKQDLFHVLCRRHSEPFAIVGARRYGSSTPVQVERFATSLFGLTTRGAHLVAYTCSPPDPSPNSGAQKKIGHLWISRRSAHLYTYPGMLDVTVAGGVKAGVSPIQTIIEEAHEEASLPEGLVRSHALSRGVVSHMGLTGDGFPGEQGLVTPDFIYVYDMELSEEEDSKPRPNDEEVEGFMKMDLGEVKERLLKGEFKPDSGAVLVDFLIRHGEVNAQNEVNLVEICARLRRRLPFRTAPRD